MKTCLITSVHSLLLSKVDNSSSERFLKAVEQSGCQDRLYEAKPQVVMRWLTSFWVNAASEKLIVTNHDYEKLASAKSYAVWLKEFERVFLESIKENALPKKIPSMPAFYTFE